MILAVGVTRGWRAPLVATGVATIDRARRTGRRIRGALSLLALAATMSPEWTVTVVATEYGFDPNHLTFRAGAAYRRILKTGTRNRTSSQRPAF